MGRSMMGQRPTQWGNHLLGTVEEEVERLVNSSYQVVSAEEFQMMLVQFQAKTIDYRILGEERNREKLPFQAMPASV